MKVDILDVGAGNTQSLVNWFQLMDIAPKKVSDGDQFSAKTLVLPGVGAAKNYITQIKLKRLDEAIAEHLKAGGRIVGICLGFQALFEHTEEDGGVEMLGLLKGRVCSLGRNHSHTTWEDQSFDLRGYNLNNTWQIHNLSRKKKFSGRVFYNHRYAVLNQNTCDMQLRIPGDLSSYTAMIVKDAILGFQFHPEKSQQSGKQLMELLW